MYEVAVALGPLTVFLALFLSNFRLASNLKLAIIICGNIF